MFFHRNHLPYINELIHVSTWISYHELHSSINIITSFNPIFLPKPRYFKFRFRDSTPGDSLGWAPEKVTVRWKRRYAAWMHQRTTVTNDFPDFSWGEQLSNEKKPGLFRVYRGLYCPVRDYNKPLYGSLLNNQCNRSSCLKCSPYDFYVNLFKWMSETFQHF